MSDVHFFRTVDDALVRSLPETAPLVGRQVEIILREVESQPTFPIAYSPNEPVPDDEPDWDPDAIERVSFRHAP